MKDMIQKSRELVLGSNNIVVLTGAGISSESGVPTFRGEEGLWKNFRAEELATPEAFERDPKTVWEWYDWRRGLLRNLKPNAAHFALVELEKRAQDFALITQNVDGLHEAAGSENILELHGNIWRVKCAGCGFVDYNWDVPIDLPPYCANCDTILRPDVVWFGEPLNENILEEAMELLKNAELTIVVGTSGYVQPAASMATYAKSHGSKLVEVNVKETPNKKFADCFLLGKAGDILPQIISG